MFSPALPPSKKMNMAFRNIAICWSMWGKQNPGYLQLKQKQTNKTKQFKNSHQNTTNSPTDGTVDARQLGLQDSSIAMARLTAVNAQQLTGQQGHPG